MATLKVEIQVHRKLDKKLEPIKGAQYIAIATTLNGEPPLRVLGGGSSKRVALMRAIEAASVWF